MGKKSNAYSKGPVPEKVPRPGWRAILRKISQYLQTNRRPFCGCGRGRRRPFGGLLRQMDGQMRFRLLLLFLDGLEIIRHLGHLDLDHAVVVPVKEAGDVGLVLVVLGVQRGQDGRLDRGGIDGLVLEAIEVDGRPVPWPWRGRRKPMWQRPRGRRFWQYWFCSRR